MTLLTTPLDALHRELGARMVPFAGYDMPVQYRDGIIKEHQHTRTAAGLFDVSHMGQVVARGEGLAEQLERLMPTDFCRLTDHQATYALLMNDQGGVRDDLIVTRWSEETFFLVINAACKHDDLAYLRSALPQVSFEMLEEQALLALQGPQARHALVSLCPEVGALPFMCGMPVQIEGSSCYITCSGYTGEDGFEISCPADAAERIARRLLQHASVAPVGLGARDSLRLEAGLSLYGHELSQCITPIEAGLNWAIAKIRRPGGERAGGYPGAAVVAEQLEQGTERLRVGLAVQGRRPVREGQAVIALDGSVVGEVCSGAFSATLEQPIAMAFVTPAAARVGTQLNVDVRGTSVATEVVPLPFVPQRYFRG